MSRRSGKARSGGPLPSLATLRRAYRGDATRGPELVAGRSVAKTALLGTRLFGPDVSIAKASRWIEIFTVVLREGVMSRNALDHALQRWSRATISRDVHELVARGFLFRPEFERAPHRVKWIAMDRPAAHRFYVATKKTPRRPTQSVRCESGAVAAAHRRIIDVAPAVASSRKSPRCMGRGQSSASDGAPARDGLGSDPHGWRPEDQLRRAGRGVGDTCRAARALHLKASATRGAMSFAVVPGLFVHT
jgi:hypothetical protein